jgi:hypothetical protein
MEFPETPRDVSNTMQQVTLAELGISPEDEDRLKQLGVAYDINANKPGHGEFWWVPLDIFTAVSQWHDQGQPGDLLAFLGV